MQMKKCDLYDGTFAPAVVDWGRRASFQNITGAATTVVKSGPGVLQRIILSKPVSTLQVTTYDNTAASGTKIGTILLPLVLLTDYGAIEYGLSFSTGLTIVTSATTDITVVYN